MKALCHLRGLFVSFCQVYRLFILQNSTRMAFRTHIGEDACERLAAASSSEGARLPASFCQSTLISDVAGKALSIRCRKRIRKNPMTSGIASAQTRLSSTPKSVSINVLSATGTTTGLPGTGIIAANQSLASNMLITPIMAGTSIRYRYGYAIVRRTLRGGACCPHRVKALPMLMARPVRQPVQVPPNSGHKHSRRVGIRVSRR